MRSLERISQFAGNTFAIWVILFAVIAYVYPDGFAWIGDYINILLGVIIVWYGAYTNISGF